MKRGFWLIVFALILGGCVTYRFQRDSSLGNGYVVERNQEAILEYTVGLENRLPQDLSLAKERFQRRKKQVEYFYQKMGYLKSRTQEFVLDPVVSLAKICMGFLRLPFIAVSEYRARHNPEYKARLRQIQEARQQRQEARINRLKELLNEYIQQDLALEFSWEEEKSRKGQASSSSFELSKQTHKTSVTPKKKEIDQTLQEIEAKVMQAKLDEDGQKKKIERPQRISSQAESAPKKKRETVAAKSTLAQNKDFIKAVIVARPKKGFSPLRVKFSGGRSFSRVGKIVAYEWDFGDGDVSTKKNPTNTYWSTTFGVRTFRVILTVSDSKGNKATTEEKIEVQSR